MSKVKSNRELDTTSEDKIKSAARVVFHKKGFAATRTRDIAEEAGINLALLNYYFRSKEKLFEMIMQETMMSFMKSMVVVYNDEKTSLDKKIELICNNYIDLLLVEAEIPLFIMSELRSSEATLFDKLNIKELITGSFMFKQITVAIKEGKLPPQNPFHFLTNTMSLVMFPFMANPMLKIIGSMNDEQFKKMMMERKKLIPMWIKATLKVK